MRNMTGIAAVRVQETTPAQVFRASEDFAAACRLVSGQECFGSAAAVWQVESVSGAGLAGAAATLGLIALGAGLLERHGYVRQQGQEALVPATGLGLDRNLGLGWNLGRGRNSGLGLGDERPQNDGSGISERDYDSSKGDNGSKPMTLWDFRTSSPPG